MQKTQLHHTSSLTQRLAAELHAFEADPATGPAHGGIAGVVAKLVLALLFLIFERLDPLFARWQAGLIPLPTPQPAQNPPRNRSVRRAASRARARRSSPRPLPLATHTPRPRAPRPGMRAQAQTGLPPRQSTLPRLFFSSA